MCGAAWLKVPTAAHELAAITRRRAGAAATPLLQRLDLLPGATKALITQFLATPPPRTPHTTPGIDELTNREREVTRLAADGKTNHEIASELHLSVLTVRTHIQRAMTKLAARDRAQLVVLAYRNGLAPPHPDTT